MSGAVDTLFFALESDTIRAVNNKVVFVNACYHSSLEGFDRERLYLQQHFRAYAHGLERYGFRVYDSCDEADDGAYSTALVLIPKNMVEARYMIARAIMALCEGGVLICAADNKAGGGRLKKLLQEFGVGEFVDYSRNKARAVRVVKDSTGLNHEACKKALKDGAMHSVLGGRFISRPGIFGWDKVDVGSRILAEHLSDDLGGRVADLGCGYGYLSSAVLDRSSKVKKLFCVDADKRALQACEWNLQMHVKGGAEAEYLWLDLVTPETVLKNIDWVVMNPPFHEGKATDLNVGIAFIKYAAEVLRKGGRLWMVANRQLAYERALAECFGKVDKRYEGQGFKVFECVK